MNTSAGNDKASKGDALENLLRQASPRPLPPSGHEALVRDAVRTEWKKMTARRQSRRRIAAFGIAATVIVALFVSLNSFRVAGIADVQVATISKSFGSIYFLGESSDLQGMNEVLKVSTGQTIITDDESGIALAWGNGGSLRIDANSRVAFTSADAIYLQSGRIYYDSTPSVLAVGATAASDSIFKIQTDHGLITHQGTQFMTYTDADRLSVSVREGQVVIEGTHYDETVDEGQQATFSGTRRPLIVNKNRYGDAWQWTERISPTADVDDRTVHEFLLWVSRETGLKLQFETASAEQLARVERLRGTVAAAPAKALRMWMMSIDLDWRIENGIIFISESQMAKNL